LEDIDLQRAVIADRFAGAVSLEAAVVRGEQLKVGYDPEPTVFATGRSGAIRATENVVGY
jgi:hypothetical protein